MHLMFEAVCAAWCYTNSRVSGGMEACEELRLIQGKSRLLFTDNEMVSVFAVVILMDTRAHTCTHMHTDPKQPLMLLFVSLFPG